jgi:xanthine/uracil permease
MPGVEPILENHEELAETTRNIFTALTAIFGALVIVPMVFKKELGQKIVIPVSLAFLLFYGAGTIVFLNAAHQGGRLVHEFGVRAMVTSNGQPTLQTKQKSDDDDD